MKTESFISTAEMARMREAEMDHPATEHTDAGGWCKHCGCGNDALGRQHLQACTRPAPDAPHQPPCAAGTCSTPSLCNDLGACDATLLRQEVEGSLTTATRLSFTVPVELHPQSKNLVQGFAYALAEKLRAAELKYGYGDAWRTDDWAAECQREIRHHMEKGDPRDVAIYAAFMWARGWSTNQ